MPIDATKGWWRPNGAAEWTTLLAGTGIANPDHSWDCTEGSGNLSDDIGSNTLTAANTPLYAQSATGWAGTGVGMTDATTGRFLMTGPNPDTTSQVWLIMTQTGTQAATRALFGINSVSATVGFRFMLSATGIRSNFAGASVDTATVHAAGDYVFALRYDRAASVAKIYTDLATATSSYSSTALTSGGSGLGSAGAPTGIVTLLIAMWEGANAETLDDAAIATIRSRIESPVSGGATGHYYRGLLRQMGAD